MNTLLFMSEGPKAKAKAKAAAGGVLPRVDAAAVILGISTQEGPHGRGFGFASPRGAS